MQSLSDLVFIGVYSILSCILAFMLAPAFIRLLLKYRLGKQLREHAVDGKAATIFNQLHGKKKGTPTMGGVLVWGTTLMVVLLSRIASALDWIPQSLLQRSETYLPLATLIATAVLGLIDDFYNIRGVGKAKGIDVKPKFLWLILFSAIGAWWFHYKLEYSSIHIPAVGDFDIGFWYIPLFMLVIISTANAVNITDGLDGLAGGLLMIAFGAFGIIAYAHGMVFLTALCGVICGALASFLWFNISPARFYMGDTGALSLGATLGVIALLTNSIFVLVIIAGVFVIETLSDIIQIASKKFRKKKVFLIAPLHHHFEALGWPEHTVVFRFWIIGGLLAVMGVVIGVVGMGVGVF